MNVIYFLKKILPVKTIWLSVCAGFFSVLSINSCSNEIPAAEQKENASANFAADAAITNPPLSATKGIAIFDSALNTVVVRDMAAQCVAYGNGKFAAGDCLGSIKYSSDGQIWTPVAIEDSYSITGICFGGGRFVAVDSRGLSFTSADAVSWAKDTVLKGSVLSSVSCGNGKFIAVGSTAVSSGSPLVAISPDSGKWEIAASAVFAATDMPTAVSYGNDRYVIATRVGSTYISADGEKWARANGGGGVFFKGIAFGGGQFVAVGTGGSILTSADGAVWTTQTSDTDKSLNAVAFGKNGKWVVVGDAGTILISSDGIIWSKKNSDTEQNLNAVCIR